MSTESKHRAQRNFREAVQHVLQTTRSDFQRITENCPRDRCAKAAYRHTECSRFKRWCRTPLHVAGSSGALFQPAFTQALLRPSGHGSSPG